MRIGRRELRGDAQGLLTHSLLLGMKGAALREEEYVDVSTLFGFAADGAGPGEGAAEGAPASLPPEQLPG